MDVRWDAAMAFVAWTPDFGTVWQLEWDTGHPSRQFGGTEEDTRAHIQKAAACDVGDGDGKQDMNAFLERKC